MRIHLPFFAVLLPLASTYAGEMVREGKHDVVLETSANKTQFTVSAKSDYVISSDFKGQGQGDQDAANSEFRVGTAIPIRGNVYVTATGFYKRFDFGTSLAPVPTTLQAIGADFGVEYRYNGEPAIGIRFSPGFYGSDFDLDRESFNVPVLAAASYYLTPKFIVGAGVSYDSYREYEVLPVIGFRWLVSDAFHVNALFPELNVTYACGDNVILDTGIKFAGGSFKTSSDEQNYPNTEVDYSDVRLGGGIRYSGLKPFDVYLQAGWSFQREFRYDDPDKEFKTDGSPYAGLQISAKF